MTRLSFRYKNVKIEGWPIKRPIIPITLSHGEKSIELEAIIDSGSDFMLITKEIAEFLGLELGKKEEEVGICGEKCKTVMSHCNITITDGKETARLLSKPIQVILEGNAKLDEILIGRFGFFDEFDITFRENSSRIELISVKRH